MSVSASRWAWSVAGLTASQKFVLIALADYSTDDGICWPSGHGLERKTGMSYRSVRRALTVLVERNLVVILTPGSGRKTNLYQLAIGNAEVCHSDTTTDADSKKSEARSCAMVTHQVCHSGTQTYHGTDQSVISPTERAEAGASAAAPQPETSASEWRDAMAEKAEEIRARQKEIRAKKEAKRAARAKRVTKPRRSRAIAPPESVDSTPVSEWGPSHLLGYYVQLYRSQFPHGKHMTDMELVGKQAGMAKLKALRKFFVPPDGTDEARFQVSIETTALFLKHTFDHWDRIGPALDVAAPNPGFLLGFRERLLLDMRGEHRIGSKLAKDSDYYEGSFDGVGAKFVTTSSL